MFKHLPLFSRVMKHTNLSRAQGTWRRNKLSYKYIMKYNVREHQSDNYVGEVNLTSSSCKKYKYIGHLGATTFIYDQKYHYIIPKNNVFDMADSSCSDLSPSQCSAWYKFYNGMNGHKWSECSNNRNNPCDCKQITCMPTSRPTSISIIDLALVYGITGDIRSLSSLTQLTSLNLNVANNLTGDIKSLSSLTQLTAIALGAATGIRGDISSLSPLTKLHFIDLRSASDISGDISSLSPLIDLDFLNLDKATGIRGDISGLYPLTKMKTLSLQSATDLSGDITSISNMWSITYLNLSSATGISGTCGDINNIISILAHYHSQIGPNCYLPKNNIDTTCNYCIGI